MSYCNEKIILKCTKFETVGAAYSAPPNHLAAFKGPTSNGRGREKEGQGREGRGKKREQGRGGNPRGTEPRIQPRKTTDPYAKDIWLVAATMPLALPPHSKNPGAVHACQPKNVGETFNKLHESDIHSGQTVVCLDHFSNAGSLRPADCCRRRKSRVNPPREDLLPSTYARVRR